MICKHCKIRKNMLNGTVKIEYVYSLYSPCHFYLYICNIKTKKFI